MADKYTSFEGPGTNPVYNAGVQRLPAVSQDSGRTSGVIFEPFADLLDNKDIVGGQVAQGFVADTLTPLKDAAGNGVYTVADPATDTVVGLLLAATDAYDAGRVINIIKGGTVRTDIGYFKGKVDADKAALATKLGGRFDATFKTIKF